MIDQPSPSQEKSADKELQGQPAEPADTTEPSAPARDGAEAIETPEDVANESHTAREADPEEAERSLTLPDGVLDALSQQLAEPLPDTTDRLRSVGPLEDDQFRDALAAEYVLGTLDGAERQAAQSLRLTDPVFAGSVSAWERRLGELHVMAESVEPPAAVWKEIRARLPAVPPSAIRLPPLPPLPPPPPSVAALAGQAGRWRIIAAGAATMAALLALFVFTSAVAPTMLPDSLRPRPRIIVQATEARDSPSPRFIAVLQREAATPAFIVTVDMIGRSFTVKRVAADRPAGKSYELWIASNKFPAPRSLGIIGNAEFTRSNGLAPYDPAIIEEATFQVSLEPEGGSPTGAPTAVVFAGKLIQAAPGEGGAH